MEKTVYLNSDDIRLSERAHYIMQLSGYFSELVDYPGARFAFTNRLADTWYNHAYDIDWVGREPEELMDFISQVCAERDRGLCVYLSPASKPSGVAQSLERLGLVPLKKKLGCLSRLPLSLVKLSHRKY